MNDRALEEGGIGLATSGIAGKEGEFSTNQDWENPPAVRSASQSSSPSAFIPRTNENDARGSATDERPHIRLPVQDHSRPLSGATDESVIVPEARRPGGIIHLDPEDPGLWLVDHHLYGLIEEIVPSAIESFPQRILSSVKLLLGEPPQGQRLNKNKKPEDTYRISFAEMQRMHLRKLQIGLVDHAVTMYSKKEESNNWERDLAAYIQAMKDYDYMMECSRRERDPCLVTGEREIDHYVTQKVVKAVLDKVGRDRLEKPDEVHPLGPWEHDSEPIGGTRTRTLKALSFKDFRDRLFLATLGAALLLGPMWLMVLHNTLYTGLVTTTVCPGQRGGIPRNEKEAKVIAFEQFELGHFRGASHDTSRIVRTSYEAPEYVDLAKSSYRDWRQLEEDSKQKLLTITGGVVLLPKDGPEVPAVDEWTNSIPTARQWAKGLDANNLPYELLDHEQTNKRWPQFDLKDDLAAIYSADTGIVHAAKSVTAMQFLARLQGADMKERCKVHRVIPRDSAAVSSSSPGVTVETSQGTFSASKVILAADGWVNELLEPLGLTIPLKVTQEQVTYFRPTNPRLYEPDQFPVWIWVGNEWYYGFPAYGEPTVKAGHDNAEQYTTPSARSFIPSQTKTDELDSAMQHFMPDRGRQQMRTVTCLYTRTPGRQFVVSPIKEQKDIIVLMGAAHAFKFAPTIGRAAAELAIDGETKEDISKFSLDTIVKPFPANTTAGKSRL